MRHETRLGFTPMCAQKEIRNAAQEGERSFVYWVGTEAGQPELLMQLPPVLCCTAGLQTSLCHMHGRVLGLPHTSGCGLAISVRSSAEFPDACNFLPSMEVR